MALSWKALHAPLKTGNAFEWLKLLTTGLAVINLLLLLVGFNCKCIPGREHKILLGGKHDYFQGCILHNLQNAILLLYVEIFKGAW